ncbi:MAG: GGDEF domain-containing phosphodiesterase [Acetatifactor sp.]|nr:GGDEF domain-containing phosphodiesterase [Acetatifactor sp.]
MGQNMKQTLEYTWKDVNAALDSMRVMFDYVRLVDAEECREVAVDNEGFLQYGRECYALWNADHRCADCSSYRACHAHQKMSRTEFHEQKKYQIQSIPALITLADSTVFSCSLELININLLAPEELGQNKTKDVQETSEYLTTHDTLTGLLNWDGFCRSVRQLLLEHPTGEFLIISANIRNFMLANNLFGRTKGDEILMDVAGILSEAFSSVGVLGRNGGDVFSICIPKSAYSDSRFFEIVSRVKSLIDSSSYRLNIHFGIYEVKRNNLPISIMFDWAYMALDSIRNNLEKSIAWFDDSLLKKVLHEQEVLSNFETNLKSGQFVMFLQPQVDKTGHIEGAECLVRWILPNGTMVPPYEFISILEQSDLIASLDKYVWELAVKQLATWKGTSFEKLFLSVNVSPKDFYYTDVAATFKELCEKYHVTPQKVHVEITETAVADETQNNRETIAKLQQDEFTVEIDDFGKGSSSLSLLKDIHADVLKIDMGFLRQSENNKRGAVILESVIDMAKRLGMEVISEGIETKEQLDNLSALGCSMFQGYYFSKPIPVAAFEKMINEI